MYMSACSIFCNLNTSAEVMRSACMQTVTSVAAVCCSRQGLVHALLRFATLVIDQAHKVERRKP